VAASSAFPPVLSPAVFTIPDGEMRAGGDSAVACKPYTTRVVLGDGGIYDNLGLEAVWKRYRTVLVSDGGGHMADDPQPGRLWTSQFIRVLHAIDNQVRDLRKRQAISSFSEHIREGAYWGIRSHVRDFGLRDPLLDPPDEAIVSLAKLPTRLAKMQRTTQERLINWGYLICDTALRRWVEPGAPAGALPYPAAGVAAPEAGASAARDDAAAVQARP
jgi:NTE family protein